MALRNILNWSDPSLSGLIFGSGFVFLLSLSHFSLLSVIAYFSLTLLFFCMGCKVYVHLMGTLKKPCKDPLAKVEVMDLAISGENIEALLAPAVEGLNTATAQLRGFCLVQNYFDSAKFAAVLYVATFIGSFLNTLTILTITWVIIFVLPTVYEQNQAKADEILGQVKNQYEAINKKVAAMLPAQAATAQAATAPAAAAQKEE
eukprot:TRINITY_DN1640_c0_g1_i1.p1 TRINITY_DN1640_c0_g1~~TRINITY_DN1640_c0_g1_i1.p1  ORF type:complete len:203 (+),score=78.41 TRINITY_DN1640_c0_g1_i1:139-747(+)